MVPCLHQGNIYTKRKLRVWRDQKCIPLVGAITILTCAGRQNTPSRGRRYRAQNGKLRKLGRTYRHGTVFAPRKYYTKRKLRVWRDQKCIPLVGAIPPLTCAGRQNTPSRGRRYRAQNGKLRKLGRTYRHGTVFAPRKYLHQKEATVWRDQKCIPLVGAIPHLPVRAVKIPRLEGGSIGPRTESCVNSGTDLSPVFAPRKYLYQKEATGMERPEMYSASRCNNPTYLCGPSKYPVSREAV